MFCHVLGVRYRDKACRCNYSGIPITKHPYRWISSSHKSFIGPFRFYDCSVVTWFSIFSNKIHKINKRNFPRKTWWTRQVFSLAIRRIRLHTSHVAFTCLRRIFTSNNREKSPLLVAYMWLKLKPKHYSMLPYQQQTKRAVFFSWLEIF